jgi:hypothetical protein
VYHYLFDYSTIVWTFCNSGCNNSSGYRVISSDENLLHTSKTWVLASARKRPWHKENHPFRPWQRTKLYLISFWSQKYFELSCHLTSRFQCVCWGSVLKLPSWPETWIGPDGFKLNLDGGINTRALISFRRRWFATWFSTLPWCLLVCGVSWVFFSMWLAPINPYWLLWWRRHRFAVSTKLVEQVYNCTVCHV